MEGVLLGVRVPVGEFEAVAPAESVCVGVSVIVGVPVGVADGVGVPVLDEVGVTVEVGVGVLVEEGDGTITEPGLPFRRICRAHPSPAKSVVQGVVPHGCAVGPYCPIAAYGRPGLAYGI